MFKIRNLEDLLGHPVLGGSWEGYHRKPDFNTSILDYSTLLPNGRRRRNRSGAINYNQTRIAIEIKRSLTPAVSKGFIVGGEYIKASHKYFVYPGQSSYVISKDVNVVPSVEMMEIVGKLVIR